MAIFSSFEGTNKLRSKKAFNERAKYEVGLFDSTDYSLSNTPPDDSIPQEEIDTSTIPKPMKKFFIGEYQYYGKVNELLQPVYANKKKLKLISNKESIFALDFVANKFADLKQNFVKCTTVGSISKDDPYLSVLKPVKGYISVDDEYKNYINSVLDGYNKDYLIKQKRSDNIYKFDDYIKSLLQYSKLTSKTIPISKSFFVKTNFCPMHISGLVIELADLQYSNDSIKYDFTKSPNFKFFRNACIKHGFSIDYNAPWRIIADLDSPPMKEMMVSMGYNRETIFISHFNKASESETENIKKTIYSGYSSFVRARPNIYKTNECKTKVTTKTIVRQQMSIKGLNDTIDEQKAIEIYISIRASEQEINLSNQVLQNLNNNAFSYTKSLGIQAAVNYIEEEMSKIQLAGTGTLNTIVLNYNKRLKG